MPTDDTAPRPNHDAPADLPPPSEAPAARSQAEGTPDDSADGTERYVVMQNRETGQTQVARDADVASLPQDGYDVVSTHDTPGGAEQSADEATGA